jgi:hypothetical protein
MLPFRRRTTALTFGLMMGLTGCHKAENPNKFESKVHKQLHDCMRNPILDDMDHDGAQNTEPKTPGIVSWKRTHEGYSDKTQPTDENFTATLTFEDSEEKANRLLYVQQNGVPDDYSIPQSNTIAMEYDSTFSNGGEQIVKWNIAISEKGKLTPGIMDYQNSALSVSQAATASTYMKKLFARIQACMATGGLSGGL